MVAEVANSECNQWIETKQPVDVVACQGCDHRNNSYCTKMKQTMQTNPRIRKAGNRAQRLSGGKRSMRNIGDTGGNVKTDVKFRIHFSNLPPVHPRCP